VVERNDVLNVLEQREEDNELWYRVGVDIEEGASAQGWLRESQAAPVGPDCPAFN
jgi:hypothetical protein